MDDPRARAGVAQAAHDAAGGGPERGRSAGQAAGQDLSRRLSPAPFQEGGCSQFGHSQGQGRAGRPFAVKTGQAALQELPVAGLGPGSAAGLVQVDDMVERRGQVRGLRRFPAGDAPDQPGHVFGVGALVP